MKCTKQQKVLGGVMIAGLIAVGVDRLTSHPASADAAVLNSPSEFAVAKVAATSAAAGTSQVLPLATRLRTESADVTVSRGAFELASVWQAPEQPAAPAIDPAVEAFAGSHKLLGTLARGDHSGAIIDGKLCIVGQSIDGFKLVSVTGHTATFANAHCRTTLLLKLR